MRPNPPRRAGKARRPVKVTVMVGPDGRAHNCGPKLLVDLDRSSVAALAERVAKAIRDELRKQFFGGSNEALAWAALTAIHKELKP
jgi:hypothetical protein